MWSIESMACEKRLSWFSAPLPTESCLQRVTRVWRRVSGGLWFVVRGIVGAEAVTAAAAARARASGRRW